MGFDVISALLSGQVGLWVYIDRENRVDKQLAQALVGKASGSRQIVRRKEVCKDFYTEMGSHHSLNRKESIKDYGIVQGTHKDKLLNNNDTQLVLPITGIKGKENVILSHQDVNLATAYLHKYAHVSKRRMKTMLKPIASKTVNNTSEARVLKPAQTNSTLVPVINCTPNTNNTINRDAKSELTSSHFTMKCLATFVCARYLRALPHLSIIDVITWMNNVDRALTLSGWQCS